MSNCFITADLHLAHRKIIEYEPARQRFGSIEEHDQHIEDCWRSTVGKHDVVYVLGDVWFNLRGKERFRSFPGIKKLVMGNHDRSAKAMEGAGFKSIQGSAVLAKELLLTHLPVHPMSIQPRFRANVHGHIHGRRVMLAKSGFFRDFPDPRYINVALEHTNFYPVELEEIRGRL